jgi:hypothetical protein
MVCEKCEKDCKLLIWRTLYFKRGNEDDFNLNSHRKCSEDRTKMLLINFDKQEGRITKELKSTKLQKLKVVKQITNTWVLVLTQSCLSHQHVLRLWLVAFKYKIITQSVKCQKIKKSIYSSLLQPKPLWVKIDVLIYELVDINRKLTHNAWK